MSERGGWNATTMKLIYSRAFEAQRSGFPMYFVFDFSVSLSTAYSRLKAREL